MELRDFIVAPFIIFLVCLGAYMARPYLTDEVNRRYFMPALIVRIIGAILVGFIYQFYYGGGDTFNYHSHGSRIIWEVTMNNPIEGLRLIFGDVKNEPGLYRYSPQILYFFDPGSYFVVRIAAVLDIFTFSSYVGTAVLFACISFLGAWTLFLTFYKKLPESHLLLALTTLFIPSLFFWGSGVLKETIVLASLGAATYMVDKVFIQHDRKFLNLLILVVSVLVIFEVKKFVLQAFIPAAILWVYFSSLISVRSMILRILIFPLAIGLSLYLGYWTVWKVGEGDDKYALDKLVETSRITAYDIGFYSGRDAGSRYSLGELDGTFLNMIQLAPAAINVTLFRPYLWEIRNPLMAFNALESLSLFALTVFALIRYGFRIISNRASPEAWFGLTFALVFAFAIGISTYNFGTVARYKTPLLPYYCLALIFLCKNPKPQGDAVAELDRV